MTIATAHRSGEASPLEGLAYAPGVYGSLLVTTLVVIQWRGDAAPQLIGLSLLIAVAAFWLAHAWSEIVAERVHGRVGLARAGAIARSESSMLASVIVPGILLGLPLMIGLEVDVAIGAALLASLVQLFLWGLVAGLAAHGSRALAFGVALIDCGLGIAVVGLKVIVLH